VKYNLEYVYGYRSADSRQNVFFNSTGQAVYMTAALGVILDFNSNSQKFFGGGQVDNTAKNVANDENAHTDDITSIAISEDRNWAVSG
jgi:microtubule-associated protein-like 6